MAKQYLQKGRGYAKFLVFFPVHLNLLSLHFVDILLVFSRIRVKSLFVTKFPLAFGKVIENCGLQIIDCCTISQPSENSRQCYHIHLEIFRHYYLSSSLAIQESFISSETFMWLCFRPHSPNSTGFFPNSVLFYAFFFVTLVQI